MTAPSPFPRLFEPGHIGSLRIRNRVVMAPITTIYGADNGDMTEITLKYYEERARGGVGLIISEAVCVDAPEGRQFATLPCLDREGLIPSHNEVVEAVHSYDAKIALQLHHAGRLADPRIMKDGQVPVGPSKITSTTSWRQIAEPRELTIEEIQRIVRKYAEAADRGKRAGYDAIELHMAHGYLPHSFIAEKTNQRTDQYGGSLENRLRFPLEIVQAVKDAVGKDFPIICQFSAEGGYDFSVGMSIAQELEKAGADALHVSIGGVGPISVIPRDQSHMARPQGYLAPFAEAIKKQSNLPVITVGEIKDPHFAEEILAAGQADFVAVGRSLIADPDWPRKAEHGHADEIRRCPSCGLCEMSWVVGVNMRCLVNADVGREREFSPPHPAATKKKVIVLGGDAAGLEAARVAALRGHQVDLYTAEDELGALQLKGAAASPQKERMQFVREFLVSQPEKVGVVTHLGNIPDRAAIEKLRPDVAIIAFAKQSEHSACDDPDIMMFPAHEVLAGKIPTKKMVVVWGNGLRACEVTEYLSSKGKQVTLVTSGASSALPGSTVLRSIGMPLLRRIQNYNVKMLEHCTVAKATAKGVVLRSDAGEESFLEDHDLVMDLDPTPDTTFAKELENIIPQVFTIGDYSEPWGIAQSIYQGALIARRI